MASKDNFGSSDAPGPGPPSPPFAEQSTNQQYKFTAEEMKVLSECNRESFFQRCVPLSTILGVATYYGVQTGYFKRSAKWGAAPKVVLVSILGYFVGKLSYQQKCAEKFMQLPNSRIGAILRQRKRGGIKESLDSGSLSLMPFSGTNPSDTYSDVDSRNRDLDTNIPDNSGLDDSLRPSLDNPVYEEETMPPQQNKTTTYEELRKQNREDFQKQRTRNYKEFIPQASEPESAPAVEPFGTSPRTTREEYSVPKSSKRTNKYGDVFD